MSPLTRGKLVKGILIDITGVLYESGTTVAISGSIDALNTLKNSRIPFKFVTNETQNTRSGLVNKLRSFGFTIDETDIFAPAPATCKYLIENNLIPHLLVHPKVTDEFADAPKGAEATCVVIGDAAEDFTYENVNTAFRKLLSMKNPKLISMGYNKYYKDKGELVIDLGAYTRALEFATDLKATVIGKPSPLYFKEALHLINCTPDESVMIGDDIVSDVGAAQSIDMSGIQVRTGKFRPTIDDNHPTVKPDHIADNFLSAINFILHHNTTVEACNK